MELFTVFVVAAALGTDAFSMAVGVGAGGIRRREAVIISLLVGVFHVFMPLTGLYLGFYFGRLMDQIAATIGALVLAAIGLQMLREGYRKVFRKSGNSAVFKLLNFRNPEAGFRVTSGFWPLIILAFGVSIDALSAGFGLGALRASLSLTVIVMGVVAGVMTAVGLFFGRRVEGLLGEKAQMVGGIILVAIGVRMFFS